MKIALNVARLDASERSDQGRVPERDIIACKVGDFEAKKRVITAFLPLITSLARQRSSEPAAINAFVEAGKQALVTAVRKYKPTGSLDKFQIFALDFIEKAMDEVNRPKGFFARLFSK